MELREHKNIVKFYRCLYDGNTFLESNKLYLVMEYANIGSIMINLKKEDYQYEENILYHFLTLFETSMF